MLRQPHPLPYFRSFLFPELSVSNNGRILFLEGGRKKECSYIFETAKPYKITTIYDSTPRLSRQNQEQSCESSFLEQDLRQYLDVPIEV
jgi:hypothetical protein